MTIQEVQQAYMRWQLAVGTYQYARSQGSGQVVELAEQAMIDRYEEYLRSRAQWEQGETA